MEENTSPLPVEEEVSETMTFPEAIAEATKGKRIKRLEWEDGEYAYFQVFSDGEFLCIYRNGTEYIWKVSKGDAVEEDWVIF